MGSVRYSSYLDEIAEDCWLRAGIGPGMRVLDAGCRTGESTWLAARLAAPGGSVVGWDRDQAAIRAARTAADRHSWENVEFRLGEISSLEWLSEAPFDAVVGRGFLALQADPALALRELARLVRPGGIVAVIEQEFDYGYRIEPPVASVNLAVDRIQASARESGHQLHVATSLPRTFLEAGLGWPSLRAYQALWSAGSGEPDGTWMPPPTSGAWARVPG